jgi:hypothetical protein
MVFQHTIVGDMAVCHDEAVVSDDGFPFGRRSAVDGNTFADGGMMADFGYCFFSCEFQVLRDTGDHGSGEYLAVIAYPRSVQDGDMGEYPAVIAYDYVFFDDGEGVYNHIFPYTGFRVNNG